MTFEVFEGLRFDLQECFESLKVNHYIYWSAPVFFAIFSPNLELFVEIIAKIFALQLLWANTFVSPVKRAPFFIKRVVRRFGRMRQNRYTFPLLVVNTLAFCP
jgi:hypothetical protein